MRVSRRLSVPVRSLLSLLVLLAPHIAFAQDGSPLGASTNALQKEEPPLERPFLDTQTPVTWEDTQLASNAPRLTEPTGDVWRGFVRGHCTSYVASRRRITFRGDAKRWPTNAVAAGYRLSETPVVGAVMVTRESRYGHVAYVERVNADGTFLVSEMNYLGRYKISTRTLGDSDPRIVTFIL